MLEDDLHHLTGRGRARPARLPNWAHLRRFTVDGWPSPSLGRRRGRDSLDLPARGKNAVFAPATSDVNVIARRDWSAVIASSHAIGVPRLGSNCARFLQARDRASWTTSSRSASLESRAARRVIARMCGDTHAPNCSGVHDASATTASAVRIMALVLRHLEVNRLGRRGAHRRVPTERQDAADTLRIGLEIEYSPFSC